MKEEIKIKGSVDPVNISGTKKNIKSNDELYLQD